MKRLIAVVVPLLILTSCSQRMYNPVEKRTTPTNFARVEYRPPAFIDRRIENRAAYNGWTEDRAQVERSRHPEGGYLMVKLTFFDPNTTPGETFYACIFDKNNTFLYKVRMFPGARQNRPSRYLQRLNPRLFIPLTDQTPQTQFKVLLINVDRRQVQEITINPTCPNGKTPDIRNRSSNYFAERQR